MFRSKFVKNVTMFEYILGFAKVWNIFSCKHMSISWIKHKNHSQPTKLGITRLVLKPYSSWCLLRSYFSIIRSIRRALPYGRTASRLMLLKYQRFNSILEEQALINTTHDRDSHCISNFSIVLDWFPILSLYQTPLFFLLFIIHDTYSSLSLRRCNHLAYQRHYLLLTELNPTEMDLALAVLRRYLL
jgi:hypothetical protein